jgi:SAM-dependent methyltransferase
VLLVYRVMYRVGFTPWDTGTIPPELAAVVESDGALAPARALDIGCGTGTQSVYMAGHGWRVTGVELLDQPLRRARDRASAAGVEVEFVKADASRLADAGLTPGFALVLDRGCYHGLNGDQRATYSAGVSALAAPGATFLLMAFSRNRVLAGPSGVDRQQIIAGFERDWEIGAATVDGGPPPVGPLKNVPISWYRLTRR